MILAFATTVLMLVSSLPLASSFITNATVSLSPSVSTPGSEVQVTLNLGYMSGQWYAVYLSSNGYSAITPGDIPLRLAVNRAIQGYTVAVRIPSNVQPGTYYIKVTDDFRDSAISTSPLDVVSSGSSDVRLLPSQGFVGSSAALYAWGLPANSHVSVYWGSSGSGGTLLSSATSDRNGYVYATFSVPDSVMGPQPVIVTSGSVSLVAFFNVEPDVVVQPTSGGFAVASGSAYQQVSIEGTGLPDGQVTQNSIFVYEGGGVVSGVNSAAQQVSPNGVLAQFTGTILGALSPGDSYYMVLTVGSTGIDSQFFGASTPNPSEMGARLSSSSAQVGFNVALYGYGFGASGSVNLTFSLGAISDTMTFRADPMGGVYAAFALPPLPSVVGGSGSGYTVTVKDKATGSTITLPSFLVLPSGFVNSTLPLPGSWIQVSLYGLPYTFNLSAPVGAPVVELDGHPVNMSFLNGNTVQVVKGSSVSLSTYGSSFLSSASGALPTFMIQVPSIYTPGTELTITVYGRSLSGSGSYTVTFYLSVIVG